MYNAVAKYGWKPGTMYNENHDFAVYAPKYGMENMLNGDGAVISFTDEIPNEFDYVEFFARPTKDTKAFSGQLFSRKAWLEYVDTCKANDTASILDESKVLLAPIKTIYQEVRCWVVGGKIVTASRYRLGKSPAIENYDQEMHYINFAQEMADIYQPAEAFVMDICDTEQGLKIVELNCINTSGFYKANMNALVESIENYFDR
jgi:hypothetical protein